MNLLELLNGLVSQINSLQQALTDAQSAADSVSKEAYDSGFSAGVASVVINPDLKFTQADLDKAFQDGVASVVPAGDKIYTQLEFDNAINPLKDQVNALTNQVGALEVELAALKDSMQPAIDQAVMSAKAEMKVAVLAAYEKAQSDENAVEGSLKTQLESL